MKVLLTNDDGIYAPGLWALFDRFSNEYELTVIAPDRERSAVGHGITLHEPLRVTYISQNETHSGLAVNGTPADCIKIGVLDLLDEKPDIVISGINPGVNTGININYSGTVAAAREAALYGIPGIAVSIQGPAPENYATAAECVAQLLPKIGSNHLPKGIVFNVNVPDLPLDRINGTKITKQGTVFPTEYIRKNKDPRDRLYFWYGCDPLTALPDAEVDDAALQENFISITPLSCDTTCYSVFERIKDWEN